MNSHQGNKFQRQQEGDQGAAYLSDIRQSHENRIQELRVIRDSHEALIQEARRRNEELRKQQLDLTHALVVAKEKISVMDITGREKLRYAERESLKRVEQECEELDNELLVFGIEMQKDIHEIASGVSQMHMEYGTADRMNNGVRTLMLKADEARKQLNDVAKKIRPLEEAVSKAEEVDLINLSNMSIVLSASEQLVNKKKDDLVTLKQDIRRMGATPMTKEQITMTSSTGFSESTFC